MTMTDDQEYYNVRIQEYYTVRMDYTVKLHLSIAAHLMHSICGCGV